MYVGITQSLRNDIRARIQHMRSKELEALGDGGIPVVVIPDLNERVWGGHLFLKNQMPETWKPKYKTIYAEVPYMGRTYSGHFHLPMEYENVPEVVQNGYSRYDPEIKFAKHETLPPELAAWAEQQRLIKDVHERWDKVEEQLFQFIDKCRSLNEALKLWPQVAMYIPKHYLDKAEEKREQQKRDASEALDALKEVDTEHLTAAVVIARMSDNKQ